MAPKEGLYMYIFFEKTCHLHLILLDIVENKWLLHGFIAQAAYLTKFFFLGYCPKCSISIRLHDSSKCIISIKSSVNELCWFLTNSLGFMEVTNWSCPFSLVWSDKPRHTQSAPKKLMTTISIKVELLSWSFCILQGIYKNYKLILRF